jgi:ABC-type Fe3+-citrate transport system substrate-binding protein
MTSGVWKRALERACEKYEYYISHDMDAEKIARMHGMLSSTEEVDPVEITEHRVLDYLAALTLTSLGISDDKINDARQAYNEVHWHD